MKEKDKKLKLKLYSHKDLFYIKGSAKRIKIPDLDINLALFLGIMWGDGWLLKREKAKKDGNWRIGIVEDDIPLVNKFISLTEKLFSIKPKINDRITKQEAYLSNRIVYEILSRAYGFPDGEKINRLSIPKEVLKSKKLVCSFLSGVFSTDGKFTVYKGYPRICIESATLKFINEIQRELYKLQFNPRIYTWNRKKGNKLYGVYLNGFKQVKEFNKKIGFIGEKTYKLERFIDNMPRFTAP